MSRSIIDSSSSPLFEVERDVNSSYEESEDAMNDVGYLSDDEPSIGFSDGTADSPSDIQTDLPIAAKGVELEYEEEQVSGEEDSIRKKRQLVESYRSELRCCQDRMDSLYQKLNKLSAKLDGDIKDKNIASQGLVTAQIEKTKKDIEDEKLIKKGLQEALEESELAVLRAELEAAKCSHLKEGAAIRELSKINKKEQEDLARANRENALVEQFTAKKKMMETKYEKELLRGEDAKRRAIQQAKHAQEVFHVVMQESMERERAKREIEENKSREMLEKRIEAVLQLKRNMDASRDAIKRAHNARLSKSGSQTRANLTGVDEVRQKKLEEFSEQINKFDQKKKERELAIVEKLLKEDERLKRLKVKMGQPHWQQREVVTEGPPQPVKRKLRKKNTDTDYPIERRGTDGDDQSATPKAEPLVTEVESVDTLDPASTVEMKSSSVTLAYPEFVGLWDDGRGEERGELDVPDQLLSDEEQESGEDTKEKYKCTLSKMEKDILKRKLERQKENIIKKQVVAGREFKGPTFKSAPEVVEFKDFDVGCVYKRSVVLTNISYTATTCRLLGVSENLKDFITCSFAPPGMMSAGITCSLTVTFEPKLNEDMEGCIEMLSQTGPFSIPVMCIRKKCLLATDVRHVDFGRVCRGETVTRKITVKNSGALASRIFIRKVPSIHIHSEGTSQLPLGQDYSTTVQSSELQHTASGVLKDDQGSLAQHPEAQEGVAQEGVAQEGVAQEGVVQSGDMSSNIANLAADERDNLPQHIKSAEDETISAEEEKGVKQEHPTASTPLLLAESIVSVGGGGEPADTPPGQLNEEENRPVPSPADISVSPVEVMLGGCSSAVITVTFSPSAVGRYSETYLLESSDHEALNIEISVEGECVNVPVHIHKETISLGICEFGKIYQDSVTFHNSSSSSLQMRFELPSDSKPYLEVLPEQAAITGNATQTFQLRFTPKPSMSAELIEDNQFSAAIHAIIANQVLPVDFTVKGNLTETKLEFSPAELDFGSCSVCDAVVSQLQVYNNSDLPQEIGFVNLPTYVEIQPCNGFLTLLPHETVTLDVIVSANKPGAFFYKLHCLTIGGKNYTVPCKGYGVDPPVKLLSNAVYISEVPLYSSATVTVQLEYTKRQSGGQSPSLMFDFKVPEGAPITLSPTSGVIREKEKKLVQLDIHPKLHKEDVTAEAQRLADAALEKERRKQEEERQKREEEAQKEVTRKGRKSIPPKSGQIPAERQISQTNQGAVPTIDKESYMSAAQLNLLTTFVTQEHHFRIPCFISSGTDGDSTTPSPSPGQSVSYREEDVVFLDVDVRVIRPSLVVVSDNGSTRVEFGSLIAGERTLKEVYIKNISDQALDISTPFLNVLGPFEVVNALRPLAPGAVGPLVLSFSPPEAGIFHEQVHFKYSENSHLKLLLTGQGILCSVTLEGVEKEAIDFGCVVARDKMSTTIKLCNNMSQAITFAINLENGSFDNPGVCNLSGSPVFQCHPTKGEIEPATAKAIEVSFHPDHPSLQYCTRAKVFINGKSLFMFVVLGQAWSSTMFARLEHTTSAVPESLLPSSNKNQKVLGLSFVWCLRDDTASVTEQCIVVGTASSSTAKKSGGEFSFETLQGPDAKHFTINPIKGSVEGGTSKLVNVSFAPPKGLRNGTVDSSCTLNLKGETSQQLLVLLRGRVIE